MGSAVSLRDDFDGAELRRLAKRSRDGPQSRRLLALAEIYDGGRRRDAARIGDDFLRGPHDLTIDAAGRLLVADSGNDRTLIFRLAGRKGQWAGVWAGEQASPEGVAAAADGRVYVTNARTHTVLVLKDGAIVQRLGGPGRSALDLGYLQQPNSALPDQALGDTQQRPEASVRPRHSGRPALRRAPTTRAASSGFLNMCSIRNPDSVKAGKKSSSARADAAASSIFPSALYEAVRNASAGGAKGPPRSMFLWKASIASS